MNIAIITPWEVAKNSIGGTERFVKDLSYGFKKLGHKVIKKYDIDTLFKEDSSLIDYYENMIINKTLL